MIKNIIFDMGGVLVNYEPEKHLQSLSFNDNTIELLLKHVFNSETWHEIDRGTYTFEEAIEFFSKKHPTLKNEIALTLKEGVTQMMSVKHETSDFLKELKKEGFKIYILSNFAMESYEYILSRYDYFNFVDEKIISGEIKMIKPNKDIYEHMLEKLKIIPSESIFIDDLQRNLDTANAMGINTVLFTNIDEVRQKVRELIDGK